jgi:hypothetical protein
MANTPLSHRAMLIALNQRAWKGTATDREVAAQAEMNAAAEQGTMTVIKQLTPKHLIQPIKSIMTLGRQEHYKMTVPGLFRGQALLSTALFEEYMLTQQEIKDQFMKAVDDFVGIYPSIRDKAKTKLGTAYKDRDFPSASQIKSYFDYSVQPSPVPEVNDWRLDGVDPKDVEGLRNEVEDSVREMYNEATRTIYDRAKEALEKLYSQATNYSTDAPGAMLRDASIEGIKEISGLVCSMNVTGDPLLDKIGKEMFKKFHDLDASELRRSADQRKDIATKAQAILAKMVTVKRVAA